MNALQQQAEKCDALRDKISTLFKGAAEREKVEESRGYEFLTPDEANQVKQVNQELNVESKEYERLLELSGIAEKTRADMQKSKEVVNPYGHATEKDSPAIVQVKSLGELLVTNEKYLAEIGARNKNFSVVLDGINVKTLLSEAGTGFAPQVIRTGLVVPSAQQLPSLIDTVPTTTTDQIGVKYMLESTYTNNAAEIAEDGVYSEGALNFTEENQPIQKIGTSIPATDEQLADIPGMQDRINNRLMLMVQQRLDSQLANGNGSGANLMGLLNVPGINTYARASNEPNTDAIKRSMTKVRTIGFANPTAVWMNPNDWQNIELMRTADGIYIWGNPGSEIAPRIWGLPVAQSTYVVQGTGFVGDFAVFSELSFKAGLEFEITNSHGTDFLSGVQRIRCQLRCAFVVYRPSAFTEFSNLQ